MPGVLNQIGQQQLTVSGVPVGITAPLVTTGVLCNELGVPYRKTVSRMLVTVHDNPVRWRADGIDPSGGVEGNLLSPGEKLGWTDPNDDYRGPIALIKFVLDTTATGDAHLEIAMFS